MEAVNTIKNQTTNYAVKSVTTSIAYYLNQGKSFSYAISRLPEYFDE
jgi:type II secretory pathway component PulF